MSLATFVAFHFLGCGAIQGWAGKVLHARIKVVDGAFTGGAFLYVATSTTCATYDFGYAAPAMLASAGVGEVRQGARFVLTSSLVTGPVVANVDPVCSWRMTPIPLASQMLASPS